MKYLDMDGLSTFWSGTKEYVDEGDKYTSSISTKTLEMPEKVGGISKGTSVSTLEGKTISQLLDDMLFPTVYPTFINPSATLSLIGYEKLQEVGALAPKSTNFNATYDAGAIMINGEERDDRGGTQINDDSFIYVNGVITNKTLPTTVALGDTTYTYRAAYNKGPQPKDNKGGDYSTPLIGGTVDSDNVTINGTYPWYATLDVTKSEPQKQPLIKWDNNVGSMTGIFKAPATGIVKTVILVPRQLNTFQWLNTLSGKYEPENISVDWKMTSGSFSDEHTNRTYYKYEYVGKNRAETTIKLTF